MECSRILTAVIAASAASALVACGPEGDPPASDPEKPAASESPSETPAPAPSPADGPETWAISPDAFGPFAIGDSLDDAAATLGAELTDPYAEQGGSECLSTDLVPVDGLLGALMVAGEDGAIQTIVWNAPGDVLARVDPEHPMPATHDGISLGTSDVTVFELRGDPAHDEGWGGGANLAWTADSGDNRTLLLSTTSVAAPAEEAGWIRQIHVFADEDGDDRPACWGI